MTLACSLTEKFSYVNSSSKKCCDNFFFTNHMTSVAMEEMFEVGRFRLARAMVSLISLIPLIPLISLISLIASHRLSTRRRTRRSGKSADLSFTGRGYCTGLYVNEGERAAARRCMSLTFYCAWRLFAGVLLGLLK